MIFVIYKNIMLIYGNTIIMFEIKFFQTKKL